MEGAGDAFGTFYEMRGSAGRVHVLRRMTTGGGFKNRIERDGENFVVPASPLAEAFELTEDSIQKEKGDGRITTRFETGID